MIKNPVIECQKQAEEIAKGCPGCGKVFTCGYKNFKKHIRVQHKPILCEICGVSCLGKKLLDEHLAQTHVKKKITCQHCGIMVYDLKKKVF